jgi:hypothetical protein
LNSIGKIGETSASHEPGVPQRRRRHKDFLEPDRIVIGYYDEKAGSRSRAAESSCPIFDTSLSAEMIKYATTHSHKNIVHQ